MATVVDLHETSQEQSLTPCEAGCSGEEILIAKNGKPPARLTRLSNRKTTALIGAFAGKLHMANHFDAIPAEFEPYL